MSLDSVELIVSFENYFGISIPDKEAETIYTVQNLCDSVCKHLGITSTDIRLKNDVFAILKKALQKTDLAKGEIVLNDDVKNFFSYSPTTWGLLEKETGLIIPEWR